MGREEKSCFLLFPISPFLLLIFPLRFTLRIVEQLSSFFFTFKDLETGNTMFRAKNFPVTRLRFPFLSSTINKRRRIVDDHCLGDNHKPHTFGVLFVRSLRHDRDLARFNATQQGIPSLVAVYLTTAKCKRKQICTSIVLDGWV